MSLLVDTIETDQIKEVRIENLTIVLKMKSRKDNEKNPLTLETLVRQKSRAQQFLRGSNHGSVALRLFMAETQDEAREWIHALNDAASKRLEEQNGRVDSGESELNSELSVLESIQVRKQKREFFLSRLTITSAAEDMVVFEGKNIETTILKFNDKKKNKTPGHIRVKQLVGTLPKDGFRVEVEICERNGYPAGSGSSEIFRKDEVVEYDESKQNYDDSININFTVEEEYRVFLELERENLSATPKDSKAQAEAFILRLMLENDINLLYGAIYLTLQILFGILTRFSLVSVILALAPMYVLYDSQILPEIKHSLLEKFQPYFISSLLIKSKGDMEKGDHYRSDLSITEEEYELIDLFREECQDFFDDLEPGSMAYNIVDKYINTEYRLVRYLRARKYNFVKAKEMMKIAFDFRFENIPLDLVDKNPCPDWLLQYAGSPQFIELTKDRSLDRFPWYFRDKNNGNLAVIMRNGGIHWRKVLKKCNGDIALLISYGFWVLEFVMQDMDRLHEETKGEAPSYLTAVVDMAGFSFSNQLPLPQLIKLARSYLPKILIAYPELLQRVQIINAPRLFYTLWDAIYPLLPERVRSKFHIHGPGSKEKLFKWIETCLDKSDIPASYGGDLIIDGDEMCLDRVPAVGPFLPDKGESLLAKEK
mmetsp:Transcript_2215/g.2944  ORF Transcript_2215/g.2944 Transcript_2215/m.2944 type:complete len:652 (+) Transcript_2215:372-2327(+)